MFLCLTILVVIRYVASGRPISRSVVKVILITENLIHGIRLGSLVVNHDAPDCT